MTPRALVCAATAKVLGRAAISSKGKLALLRGLSFGFQPLRAFVLPAHGLQQRSQGHRTQGSARNVVHLGENERKRAANVGLLARFVAVASFRVLEQPHY